MFLKRISGLGIFTLVLLLSFFILPGSALGVSKYYEDMCYFTFIWGAEGYFWPCTVATSRRVDFSYYYVGSSYYCTCIVNYHSHGGFIKNKPTWYAGFDADCSGRNNYYANGNFQVDVLLPDNWYGNVWIPDRTWIVWGGYLNQEISLWPAYNDSCNALTGCYANAMPWYQTNSVWIGF